jgi:hypothetical protein
LSNERRRPALLLCGSSISAADYRNQTEAVSSHCLLLGQGSVRIQPRIDILLPEHGYMRIEAACSQPTTFDIAADESFIDARKLAQFGQRERFE